MSTTVVVYLEPLLEFSHPNALNKTRLNQLEPFLQDPGYEVFIYSMGHSFDRNQKIYKDLESVGVKKKQFIASIVEKEVTFFSEVLNAKFLENKKYLKQKKEAVIIIGAPLNESDWIQAADFSVLNWPSDAVKPLEELVRKQVRLSGQNNFTLGNPVASSVENLRSRFFNLGRSKRSFRFNCDEKLQTLLDLIPESEEYMRNLTRNIIELETKQLDLQNKIFIAGEAQTRLLEGQTHLLKELTVHFPLAITETLLTLLVLVLHIPKLPKDLRIVKNWYNSIKARVNQYLCPSESVMTKENEPPVIKIEGSERVRTLPKEPLINKEKKSSVKHNYHTAHSRLSFNHSSIDSAEIDLALLVEPAENEVSLSY